MWVPPQKGQTVGLELLKRFSVRKAWTLSESDERGLNALFLVLIESRKERFCSSDKFENNCFKMTNSSVSFVLNILLFYKDIIS